MATLKRLRESDIHRLMSLWFFGDVVYAILPLLVLGMLYGLLDESFDHFLALKEWSFATIVLFGVAVRKFVRLKVEIHHTPRSYKLDTGVQLFIVCLIASVLVLALVILAEKQMFTDATMTRLGRAQLTLFVASVGAHLLSVIAEHIALHHRAQAGARPMQPRQRQGSRRLRRRVSFDIAFSPRVVGSNRTGRANPLTLLQVAAGEHLHATPTDACAAMLIAAVCITRSPGSEPRLQAQTATPTYERTRVLHRRAPGRLGLISRERGDEAPCGPEDPSRVHLRVCGRRRTHRRLVEARERGAVAAVRSGIGAAPVTIDYVRSNGHAIIRYTSRNSASYFLRLPDGQYRSGKGYPATNNESLTQLRDDGKPVSAVDKSTTYATWADFRQTLQAIMDLERTLVPSDNHPLVNAPDYFGIDNSSAECAKPGIATRAITPTTRRLPMRSATSFPEPTIGPGGRLRHGAAA